jgi:hypothetical protein
MRRIIEIARLVFMTTTRSELNEADIKEHDNAIANNDPTKRAP